MYFRGCCYALWRDLAECATLDGNRGFWGGYSELQHATRWVGQKGVGQNGVKQKPCGACTCPTHSTSCSTASCQMLYATLLTEVSVASDYSLETTCIFKPLETKTFLSLLIPSPPFFFPLEAEKWVWSNIYKMLLNGKQNTSHRASCWRDESFSNVFIVRVSLREWQFPLMC